jgi:predicted MFS family arabinose efflux permease
MGLGYQYLFGGLQPDITEELGLRRGAYAAAGQARNYVIALTGPLVGFLLVRLGARPVFAVSITILSAGAMLLSYADRWSELLGATLVLGVGISGVGDITVSHAISGWFDRARGTALGFVYTASNFGGMLLVPLVASFAADESWREALRMTALATLLLLLPAAFIWPPPADSEETADVATPERGHGDMDLTAALRTRSFWILAFVHFTYFAYAVAITEHFISHLLDSGIPREVAVARWSTAIGLGIVSKLSFGYLGDRMAPRHAMTLLLGLIALSSLVLLLDPSEFFLWVFVVLFGFSYAARDVVTPLAIIDCFGLRYMAGIYGAIFPTLMIGGVAGAILSGLCFDWLGTYRPAFAALAVLNLAAVALTPLLRVERNRLDESPTPG